MLNVKITGKRCQIDAHGYTDEIMTDCALIINSIYVTMLNQDKALATIFRKWLSRLVVDPDSALWDPSATHGTGIMISSPNVMDDDAKDEEDEIC